MSTDENKTLYERYTKLLAHPERLDEILAQDFVAHDLPPSFPPGIEGMRAYRRAVMAAFPDQTSEIHEMVAEGDRVSARLTLSGTHQGAYMGLSATGRPISIEAFEIVRIADGKVVERWSLIDRSALSQQLQGS